MAMVKHTLNEEAALEGLDDDSIKLFLYFDFLMIPSNVRKCWLMNEKVASIKYLCSALGVRWCLAIEIRVKSVIKYSKTQHHRILTVIHYVCTSTFYMNLLNVKNKFLNEKNSFLTVSQLPNWTLFNFNFRWFGGRSSYFNGCRFAAIVPFVFER